MTVRIKRRASGNAGAPATLLNAELAYNEVDDILYYGKGNSAGNAVTIEAIGGRGTIVSLTGDQTISGVKTFNSGPLVPTAAPGTNTTQAASTAFVVAAVSSGAVSDGDKGDVVVSASGATWTIDNSVVTNAKMANMPTLTLKGNNTGGSAAPIDLTVSQVRSLLTINNLDNTSDATKFTNTALTGVPTAPTASAGTNTTQIATTAFVSTAVANLVDAALGDDPNFATTISTSLGNKADLTLSNLSNLTTARSNLGLGSIATQAANNVTITGGSISGTTIDGGTF
jgi:hypothetical protein